MKYIALIATIVIPVMGYAHDGHASYGTIFHEYEHFGGILMVILGLGFLAYKGLTREKR